MMERFDLHLHTEYSPDCDTHLADIEAHCQRLGVTGIAVTDHDTIEGALQMEAMAQNLKVIVAEEVTTRDGDVIGLFLRERVPPKMSALETMEAIHAQGGLVYVPHPFDKARARKTGGASLTTLLPHIDIIETFNGKAGRDHYNMLAADYARRHQKPEGGGSDAHNLRAIGTVVNEFEAPPDFLQPSRFLECITHAHIVGRRRSPYIGWLVRGRRPIRMALKHIRGQGRHG